MADFNELVRTEAYLIWQAEGCPNGQHEHHWLMAVERVRSRVMIEPHSPVIPLSLKRVMLSARSKRKPGEEIRFRASA